MIFPHLCPSVGHFLCLFLFVLPPCLFISSFLPSPVSPSLDITLLFIDFVFKYWGHPGVAQRGVVCRGGQSAARASAPACNGTRIPPVCKCTTRSYMLIRIQTHKQKTTEESHMHKHMDVHVGSHTSMSCPFMQNPPHAKFNCNSRKSVRRLLWKYSEFSLFHQNSPPSLGLPRCLTLFPLFIPFFTKGLHPVREENCLHSLPSPMSCLWEWLFLPSHLLFSSLLTSTHPSNYPPLCCSPSLSAPLCLNSFGPREQTKKGLCPGRKRWCVTQWKGQCFCW